MHSLNNDLAKHSIHLEELRAQRSVMILASKARMALLNVSWLSRKVALLGLIVIALVVAAAVAVVLGYMRAAAAVVAIKSCALAC